MAQRFDENASPIDAEKVRIAWLATISGKIAATGTEEGFFVAWEQLSPDGDLDLVGARIGRAGILARPAPVPIVNSAGVHELRPSVSHSGARSAIAWEERTEEDGPSSVGVLTFSVAAQRSGRPLRISGASNPVVAWGNDSFLVVWEEKDTASSSRGIRARRLSQDGEFLDSSSILLSVDSWDHRSPSVAFDGQRFWVAWEELSGGATQIRLTTVEEGLGKQAKTSKVEGVQLGARPILWRSSTSEASLSWSDPDGRVRVRALRTGEGLNPVESAIPPATRSIRGASAYSKGEQRSLIAWTEETGPGEWKVALQSVDAADPSEDLQPIILGMYSVETLEPQVASEGPGGYLIVWEETDHVGVSSIWAYLVDLAGDPKPGISPMVLMTTHPYATPRVAFSEGTYFVVWSDIRQVEQDIFGMTVTVGGDPGPSIPISETSAYEFTPDIAPTENGFIVVWIDWQATGIQIRSSYLPSPWWTPGASFTVAENLSVPYYGSPPPPRVATSTSNSLVVWSDQGSIQGALIPGSPCVGVCAATGSFSDPYSPVSAVHAAISPTTEGFFVSWTQSDAYQNWNSVVGLWLDHDGLDMGIALPPDLSSEGGYNVYSASGFDGRSNLVVWDADGIFDSYVFGQIIAPHLGGSPGYPDILDYGNRPSVASGDLGHFLMAFRYGYPGSIYYANLSWPADGEPCSLETECASLYCVDGICCDSPCPGGPGSCQACSQSGGAAVDGVCGPIVAGTECRSSNGPCDLPEVCDGISASCPADSFHSTEVLCRAASELCDTAEYCDGGSAGCPTDAVLPAGTLCRASTASCDQADYCDGTSKTCQDEVLPSGSVCRVAAGPCDLVESCDGVSYDCPTDALAPIVVVCEATAGTCTGPSTCSGSSTECPVDGLPIGCIPPPTATVAPPVKPGVGTTLEASMSFLFDDDDPLQRDVAPGSIRPESMSVVSGRVLKEDGLPLAGAVIRVRKRPEYGFVVSQADGRFEMALNGEGRTVFDFELAGYLPSQRRLNLTARSWDHLPDVILRTFDPSVTTIDLSENAPSQIARGSIVSDADGSRQATLLFSEGTSAEMLLGDGMSIGLESMQVRATEYTVGPEGPMAMPGELPYVTGYTYAVEFSVDEAFQAGASSVTFSKPVISYTDNFLGFPVGGRVPAAYYDRDLSAWVPSDDGRIIEILGRSDGTAILDVTGSGQPADQNELDELYIGQEELERLASLYQDGQELWRVLLPHFSPWDFNWPYGPPADAISPNGPDPSAYEPSDDPCIAQGSIIECENGVLGERIPILGTPYSLNYRSDRTPGFKESRKIRIPLTGNELPASLIRIELTIKIAGQIHKLEFLPQANLSTTFVWDGTDGVGRDIFGTHNVEATIAFVYPAVYLSPPNLARSFARAGGAILRSTVRTEISLFRTWTGTIRNEDYRGLGFGGWTISHHHHLSMPSGNLDLGSGRRAAKGAIQRDVTLLSIPGLPRGLPEDLAVDRKGNLYYSIGGDIYRSNMSGTQRIMIRTQPTFVVDDRNGGVVSRSIFASKMFVDTKSNRLYFIDRLGQSGYAYWMDLDSLEIHWFAGNGSSNPTQDGDHIRDTSIIGPTDIVVSDDGTVYISESSGHASGGQRIRAITPDGTTSTIYYEPATSYPSFAPQHLATFAGEVFVSSDYFQAVRVARINQETDPTSSLEVIHTFPEPDMGSGSHYDYYQMGFAMDSIGNLFVSRLVQGVCMGWGGGSARDAGSVVDQVSSDGSTRLVLGDFPITYDCTSRKPVTVVSSGYSFAGMGPVAFMPEGSLIVADYQVHSSSLLSFMKVSQRSFSRSPSIASPDGREVYVFADGRHVSTIDGISGVGVGEFIYDGDGRLASISDPFAGSTIISHDVGATTIIGPYGHSTLLAYDSDGHLQGVSYSGTAIGYEMEHDAEGLLTSFAGPGYLQSNFEYDSFGMLIEDWNNEGAHTILTTSSFNGGRSVHLSDPDLGTTNFLLTTEEGETTKMIIRPSYPTGVSTSGSTKVPAEARSSTTSADGTVIHTSFAPDPRWGGSAPYIKAQTIQLPSGLTGKVQTNLNALGIGAHGIANTVTRQVFVAGESSPIVSMTFDKTLMRSTLTSSMARTSSVSYNNQGLVESIQHGTLAPFEFEYDSRGRAQAAWRRVGSEQARKVDFSYYPQSSDPSFAHMAGGLQNLTLPATDEQPSGRTYGYTYDPGLRLESIEQPSEWFSSDVISLAHDPSGNLTSISFPHLDPPVDEEHEFTYTGRGAVDMYLPPYLPGMTWYSSYEYTPAGKLRFAWLPGDRFIEATYDPPSGLLTGVEYGDYYSLYENLALEYDPAARISKVTGTYGTLRHSYDGFLPISSSWSGAVRGSVHRSFDNRFRLQSLRLRGGSPVSYAYDADSLLRRIEQGTTLLEIERDSLHNYETGLLTGSTADSIQTEQRYTIFGELESITATGDNGAIWSVHYTYGNDGRIQEKRESTEGGLEELTTYLYDARGRLMEAAGPQGSEDYSYDQNGNRIDIGVFDAQDRLLETYHPNGDLFFTYAENGERSSRTQNGDATYYDYDVFGNLRSVLHPYLGQIDYIVDPYNRRIGKKINGNFQRGFLYDDQLRIVGEVGPNQVQTSCTVDTDCGIGATCSGSICSVDGSPELQNAIVSQFVYGTRSNVPDLMIRGSSTYRILSDHLGSVRFVVNISDSTIAQELEYDAWGNVTKDTYPGFQPFGFAGGLYDHHTKLVRFGARDYDPEIGRWTAKDPIRFAGGDTNLYAYVGSDPINSIDPSGLATQVIVTFDKVGPLWVGSHVAVRVDNAGDGSPALFDFGGSYGGIDGQSRGSGGFFSDEDASLQEFMRFHTKMGSFVEVHNFHTTASEEEQIARNYGYYTPGGPRDSGPGTCATAASQNLSGVGPFPLYETMFPSRLSRVLGAIGR